MISIPLSSFFLQSQACWKDWNVCESWVSDLHSLIQWKIEPSRTNSFREILYFFTLGHQHNIKQSWCTTFVLSFLAAIESHVFQLEGDGNVQLWSAFVIWSLMGCQINGAEARIVHNHRNTRWKLVSFEPRLSLLPCSLYVFLKRWPLCLRTRNRVLLRWFIFIHSWNENIFLLSAMSQEQSITLDSRNENFIIILPGFTMTYLFSEWSNTGTNILHVSSKSEHFGILRKGSPCK